MEGANRNKEDGTPSHSIDTLRIDVAGWPRVAARAPGGAGGGVTAVHGSAGGSLAREGEAVGVRPGGGQADEHVAGLAGSAVEQAVLLVGQYEYRYFEMLLVVFLFGLLQLEYEILQLFDLIVRVYVVNIEYEHEQIA